MDVQRGELEEKEVIGEGIGIRSVFAKIGVNVPAAHCHSLWHSIL